MTIGRLVLRSLWRFRRTNLGVMLGAAVSTAVITGALLVGDSMRHTLRHTAEQRLGAVQYAVLGGDRMLTAELADRIDSGASGALLLRGVASSPDGKRRANTVNIYGIDSRFAALLGGPDRPEPGTAVLNSELAAQLGAEVGDTLILRTPEPTALPIDAALVNSSDSSAAVRIMVAAITDAEHGGRFSLRAEQLPPMSVFVDRAWLAEQLGVSGRINTVLLPSDPGPPALTIDDLELDLIDTPDGRRELRSGRIFLDRSMAEDLADLPGDRVLTYMVNRIAKGDRQTPYSMVTAIDRLGGLSLADNEIAINTWLAEDLGAEVGDTLTLTYYLPDEGDRLVEGSTELRVANIVPIQGPFADRTLTPDFPGLAEADQLGRWDGGPAIDRRRIRPKDEAYWDEHRATPKAFVNLAMGQRMWANRFGTLTAIRLEGGASESQIADRIEPGPLGLSVRDIGAQAASAAKGTVDFGQLFLSLSGFILIAAVVLTATLFAMSVEQRARQLGALLAVGWRRRQVLSLILGEGLAVGCAGAMIGLAGGLAYTRVVVGALSGGWSGAVADSAVLFHASAASLIIGPIAGMAVSLISMILAVWSMSRRPARELLAGAVGKVSPPARIHPTFWLAASLLLVVGAIAISLLASDTSGPKAAMVLFAGGALLLTGQLFAIIALLIRRRRSTRQTPSPPTLARVAARNLTRRRGRTLATVITLGCGVFLVFAVAGFRLGVVDDPSNRGSGTGGFALITETTQPVRYDLNTGLGRDHYGFDEAELPAGSVVPFRVSAGDDASCLNLNQTPQPRVLGVDPELLARRQAFTFQDATDKTTGWGLLTRAASDDTVPAIADANTAQWALKIAIGDTLTLTDEAGQPYRVRLVGTIESSILQGSLIIANEQFKRLYPSTSGYRLLLVDATDTEQRDAAASLLEELLMDDGPVVTPAEQRLAQYNQVQNTYLSIFQALGGLGVMLGALGLGVIAARNLFERRPELALLSAVGLSQKRIAALVLLEHTALLVVGLLVGGLAASLATLPAWRDGQSVLTPMLVTLAASLAAGVLAILMGLRSARAGRLTDALRSD